MMHQLLTEKRSHIALLVARLIIGGIFINAGWLKVSAMTATVGFFAQLGIPAFLAYLVAYLELIGGIMLVLGLWTCLAAAALAAIMLFAIWYTRSMGAAAVMLPLATFAGLISLHGVCGGTYSIKCSCKSSCGYGDSCDCDSATCSAERTS